MIRDPGHYDYWPYIDRPKLTWPHGKKIAFWVAPNIENYEFEPPLNPHRRAMPRPLPDVIHYSHRDYGNRAGVTSTHPHRSVPELLDGWPGSRSSEHGAIPTPRVRVRVKGALARVEPRSRRGGRRLLGRRRWCRSVDADPTCCVRVGERVCVCWFADRRQGWRVEGTFRTWYRERPVSFVRARSSTQLPTNVLLSTPCLLSAAPRARARR